MASRIDVTGLKGDAALSGQHLLRVAFQLSAAPDAEWAAIFNALARELAQKQNHGIRPGFRFSYRLDADAIQVSCPTAAFTTPVKGKNAVVQALLDLVANANQSAIEAASSARPTDEVT